MDDRPIYSDIGYFSRGRSGYRPEPVVKEKHDAWWALIGLGIIVLVFTIVHFVLPTIK